MDWAPIILTLKLATVTTLLLFIVGTPTAYWLSTTKSKIRPFIESTISLPLVLPPTVLGFYLLIAFSPANGFGEWLENTIGLRLIFSFEGLVFASMIYSFPFMVHPIQAGLSGLPRAITEASEVLGKSKWTTLTRVLLPNIKPSIITGVVLSFAHTIGEFGVVLMIGGSIPNETRVASIAIYEEVETLNYTNAHIYSGILIGFAFLVLLFVYSINGGFLKRFWK